MCCHGEEYEYVIHGKPDLSVLQINPKDVKSMARAERFQVYSKLYHLFNHVSQEIHEYIDYHDMGDERIKIFLEELPNITSISRDLEEDMMQYAVSTTELDQLRENLKNLQEEISWKTHSISSSHNDIQETSERLAKSKRRYEDILQETKDLEQKKIELERKIKQTEENLS